MFASGEHELQGEVMTIELMHQALEKLGYLHPVHSPDSYSREPSFRGIYLCPNSFAVSPNDPATIGLQPYHSSRLVLLFPTILFGYKDWPRFYEGAWAVNLLPTG